MTHLISGSTVVVGGCVGDGGCDVGGGGGDGVVMLAGGEAGTLVKKVASRPFCTFLFLFNDCMFLFIRFQ